MFQLLICSALATNCSLYGDCRTCSAHYGDRFCGWTTGGKCVDCDNATIDCSNAAYGPKANCNGPTYGPTPSPTPSTPPTPPPIPENCSAYNESCDICTRHCADRHCGWCIDGANYGCVNASSCPPAKLYYGDNAKCGGRIPPPNPTPWPRYDANATFCYAMRGQWCYECVSANASMACGWCHSTKECIMGDQQGPFVIACDSWSWGLDDKCLGKASRGTILGLQVGIPIFITAVIVLGVLGCYKVIRKKPAGAEYEPLSR